MSRQYASSDEVPNEVLAARLRELVDFITKPSKRDDERLPTEFYMRIPAEVDHDADLVMSEAARRLVAPSPAVGGEVTWEEAEQVAQQFCNTAIGVRSWSKFCHVEQLDIIVEMRAALEAFVRGRGKP